MPDKTLKLSLTFAEATKFANLWDHHRNGVRACSHRGDVKIWENGCAIGTNTYVQCGCGEIFNITDYDAW